MFYTTHPLLFRGILAEMHDGSVIVIVGLFAIIYWYIHQKNKLTHETIRKMIDSGQPVNPETIAALRGVSGLGTNWSNPFSRYTTPENFKSLRAQRDLRNGILLTCIGAGLVMFIHGPGWIVLAVGVAHLVLAHLDRSKDTDDQATGGIKTAPNQPTPAAPIIPQPIPTHYTPPPAAPAPYVQQTPYAQPAPAPVPMTPAPAPVIIPPPPQSYAPPAESSAPPAPPEPPAHTPDQPPQPPFTPQP